MADVKRLQTKLARLQEDAEIQRQEYEENLSKLKEAHANEVKVKDSEIQKLKEVAAKDTESNETEQKHLNDSIVSLRNKVNEKETSNNELTAKVTDLELKLSEATQSLQFSGEENTKIIERLRNELKSKDEEFAAYQTNANNSKKQMQTAYDEQLKRITEEKQKTDGSFVEKIQSVHGELNQTNELLRAEQEKNNKLNLKIGDAEANVQKTETAMNNLKAQHAEALKMSQDETERVRSEKQDIVSQLENSQTQFNQNLAAAREQYVKFMQVQEEEKKLSIDAMTKQLAELRESLELAQKKQNEAEAARKETAIALAEQKRLSGVVEMTKMAELENANKEIQVEKDTAARANNEKKALLAHIEELNLEHRDEVQKLTDQNQASIRQFAEESKKSLEQHNEALGEKQNQINKLEQNIVELKSSIGETKRDSWKQIEKAKGDVRDADRLRDAAENTLENERKAFAKREESLNAAHADEIKIIQEDNQKMINEMQGAIDTLTLEVTNVRKSLAAAENSLEDARVLHRSEILTIEGRMKQLSAQKDGAVEREASTKKKCAEDIEAAKNQHEEVIKVFQTAKEESDKKFQGMIEELHGKVAKHVQEQSMTEKMMDDLQRKRIEEEKNVEKVTQEFDQYKQSTTAAKEDMLREIQRITSQNTILEERIKASKNQYLHDLQAAQETYNQRLQTLRDEKKRADSSYEQRLDQLAQQLSEKEHSNGQLRIKMDNVLTKVKSALQETQREKERALQEKKLLTSRIANLDQAFQKNIEELKNEYEDHLKIYKDEKKKSDEGFEQRIHELASETQRMKEASMAHEDEMKIKDQKLTEANRKLNIANLSLSESKEQRELQQGEAQKLIEQLRWEKEALDGRVVELKRDYDTSLEKVQEEYKNIHELYLDSKKKSDELHASRVEDLMEQLQKQKELLNAALGEQAKFEQSYNEQKRQNNSMKLQVEALNQTHNSSLEETTQNLKIAQEESKAVRNQLEAQRTEYATRLEQVHKDYATDMKLFTDSKEVSDSSFQTQVKEMSIRHKGISDKFIAAQNEIEKLTSDLAAEKRRASLVDQKLKQSMSEKRRLAKQLMAALHSPDEEEEVVL